MWPGELTRNRVATLALATALLGACGGGEDVQVITEMPINRDQAPAEEAPAEAEAEEEETGSARTEIVRQEFSNSARDPFTPPQPADVPTNDATTDEVTCDVAVDPLGMTDINQLRLVALITGTPVPRAMFSNTDAQGRAIIVAEGAKIGPRCSSFISDIRDNQIVVTQRKADADARVETVIQLNTARVEAEITTIR